MQAAENYPTTPKVGSSPLLTAAGWLPAEPVPLDQIELTWEPQASYRGFTGTEDFSVAVRPLQRNGNRYSSYAEAIRDLNAPTIFQNRSTYRLTRFELDKSIPKLTFTRGKYFDAVNVGEACAQEYAASVLDQTRANTFRDEVGDPCDPARRPMNIAISNVTIRHDYKTNTATFFLHWRDPNKVGHAGGLYQVVPTGIFQPSAEDSESEHRDFDLWRCLIREFAEELLDEPEATGIDYDSWPFAQKITQGLERGTKAFYLGVGVDPLTFATDLLTVVVFEASLFDELFAHVATGNTEGTVLPPLPFVLENIARYIKNEPTQAAGAAALELAWQHRAVLLD